MRTTVTCLCPTLHNLEGKTRLCSPAGEGQLQTSGLSSARQRGDPEHPLACGDLPPGSPEKCLGWGGYSASSPRGTNGTGEHTCQSHIPSRSCPAGPHGCQDGGEGSGWVGAEAQTSPHPFPGRVLGVHPWCVAAFHLKTGFESQFFEPGGAKASRASQSKQASGKWREKQTGLNFPSTSPGETLRQLGGGGRHRGAWLQG